MKNILLSLMMAVTAIGTNAQNTYNVRLGGAIQNECTTVTTMAQANISLKNVSSWVFSPAVQISTNLYDTAAMLHANMGYRTRIGDKCLFVPKVGIAGGYFSWDTDYKEGFLVGPSIDLAFELKHFVIGLTGFYSINKAEGKLSNDEKWYNDDAAVPMVSLALGYTF